MATFRLTAGPAFPAGTVLTAYPKIHWAGEPPQPGDTPRATSVSSATVDPFGYAFLEGLDDEEAYYVGAVVNGAWKWKAIRTPAAPSGGGGGASIPAVEALEVEMTAETAARISADAGLAASIAGLAGSAGQSEAQVDEQIQAKAPVTAIVWQLGTITVGSAPELDLRKGRIFVGTASGAWKLKPPTHPPASPTNEALYAELVISTSLTPTLEGIGLEGEVPLAESGKWVAVLCSRDNGATWVVVGTTPSSGVVRIATPAEGSVPRYEAGWKAVAPPWALPAEALTAAEAAAKTIADARIKALSILTGGHETSITNAPAAGAVPVAQSGSTAIWVNAPELVELSTVPRAPNINTTGKTSAQITAAFEAAFTPAKAPREGNVIVDLTNHLLLTFDGTHWWKTAALTEIA